MSIVVKTPSSVVHQVAGCEGCEKHWEDYKTAGAKARQHTRSTGHKTWVETGTAYWYEARP